MTEIGGIAAEQLRSFIERIERISEERDALGADIRDVYAEAKANGYDTKIMRQVIRERKMEPREREERESLLDLYRRALGMLADTDLGRAALGRVAEKARSGEMSVSINGQVIGAAA